MRRNSQLHRPLPRKPQRAASFASGVIAEPLLSFGGRHTHVDPKTGLALYGPYSLVGQATPILRTITVAVIGPPAMVADAEDWLRACQGLLTNDGSQPFLYPHFPGFHKDPPYNCDLIYGTTWRHVIKDELFGQALASSDFYEKVKGIVRLYLDGLEVIAGREPRPQVVLCCIPQAVVDTCVVLRDRTRRPRKLLVAGPSKKASLQMDLFSMFEEEAAVEEEWGHQNLRRGLKAEAMRFGLPTQIIWPRTLRVTDAPVPVNQRVQDLATRAWNFSTALYHKAGGSPWRLAEIDPGVCFVGVSFYREVLEEQPRLRTSMAQAFTAAGDGYVLQGNAFEWNEKRDGKSPHMPRDVAAALLRDVIGLYQKQNQGSLPARVVVHKSSRFWDEELAGMQVACQHVPQRDFVAFGSRGLQFYRTGEYPPLRGSYVKFSDSEFLLYTSGYVPYLRTYPGARVPRPLEILEHVGDSPWDRVLGEILALTKMNWNTAYFAGSDPITLAFSRRVGQILAEVPPGQKIRPEYRFYM